MKNSEVVKLSCTAGIIAEKILRDEIRMMEKNGYEIDGSNWDTKIDSAISDASYIVSSCYKNILENLEVDQITDL